MTSVSKSLDCPHIQDYSGSARNIQESKPEVTRYTKNNTEEAHYSSLEFGGNK